MAEHESNLSADHRNLISRRAALKGAASVSGLAIPAGVALGLEASKLSAAQVPADADPGLAAIEAGYDRWHEMLLQCDALERRADEARGRAWDRVPEYEVPEPVAPPEVARIGKMLGGTIDEARDPTSPVSIPQDLLDQYDAHWEERRRWFEGKPRLGRDDPDYREALRLEREKDALWKKAERLRLKLLKIPTTSPRGLLLKLALATDTPRLEDFDKRFRRPSYYGTFDTAEDLMPPLLADLRAMVEGAA